MSRLIIAGGDHTNEKVAYRQAYLVAEKLKVDGLECVLVTVPGLHSMVLTLNEVSEEEIKRFAQWLSIGHYHQLNLGFNRSRLHDSFIFDFHNTPEEELNPDNLPPDQLNIQFQGGDGIRYGEYHGRDVIWGSGRLYSSGITFQMLGYMGWSDEGITINEFTLIESPAVFVPYSASQGRKYRKSLERVLRFYPDLEPRIDEIMGKYFTRYASIPENEKKGYLSEPLISKLTALVRRLYLIHESTRA